MRTYSKTDLIELDKKIDNQIFLDEIKSLPRDIALVHLLRYYEDYVRFTTTAATNENEQNYIPFTKKGQDALHFAILWIYKNCIDGQQNELATNLNLFDDIHKVFNNAMDYSDVWDIMNLLFKEFARARSSDDKNIVVEEFLSTELPIESSNYIINPTDDPDLSKAFNNFNPSEFYKLISEINIKSKSDLEIEYLISDELFQKIHSELRKLTEALWLELPLSWELNNYNFQNFVTFYDILKTICTVQYNLCLFSDLNGCALDSTVLIKAKSQWVKLISDKTKLSVQIVESIMNDLTFNIELYKPGSKSPDAMYQPFHLT